MILLQVENLTRKPERIGLERYTLTHIDRDGHHQGIFSKECQAGKHGGAMGRGV